MNERKNDRKAVSLDKRKLIVAYLAYALDDVRAVSANGSHLLQLAIATISGEASEEAIENSALETPTMSCH